MISTPTSVPPLPPKPADSRYNSLDAWRGLACVLLVFHHTSFFVVSDFNPHDTSTYSLASWAHRLTVWGWVGVPLFFVISGYCISASIDGLRRKPHSMLTYAGRRIRRIYPPLFAAITFAVLFILVAFSLPTLDRHCGVLPHLHELSTADWIGNLTANESWLPRLNGAQPKYLMQNTWTLCYEEQFYLVTAVLLLLSARRFFLIGLLLTVSVLIWRHLARACGIVDTGFFLDGHWLLFAVGILLYCQINYAGPRLRYLANLTLILGMVYAYLDRRSAPDPFQKHLDEYLFIACGLALLLAWLKRWDAVVSTHALTWPLRWTGQRSYSIYLTHFPIVVALSCYLNYHGFDTLELWLLVVVPLCLLVSLPVGVLFYHLVEKHFQSSR